jgi:hypothetical protein
LRETGGNGIIGSPVSSAGDRAAFGEMAMGYSSNSQSRSFS